MRSFVVCIVAMTATACNQVEANVGDANSSTNTAAGVNSAAHLAAASEQTCPGENTMTLSNPFGNYDMLVSAAVTNQHPEAPQGIVQQIIENQDIGVRFVMLNGKCTARYSGETEFQGTRYTFFGTCPIKPDGEFQGKHDWKPHLGCVESYGTI